MKKEFNTPVQRDRRKTWRDIDAAYVAIGRAAGLEPGEIQTARAIDRLLYDKPNQDAETPRKVSLAAIGAALTSKNETDEDKDAGWKKAQRDVSHLFCQAYPRVGLAMQTRDKGVKRGDYHMYASRWALAAGIVAEEFNAERGRILTSQTIKHEDKGPAIGAALERLALDALGLFDKLDTLVIAPDHKPFAVVTQAQAKTFCEQNPKFKSADYTYTPPPSPEERAARGFVLSDFPKIIDVELTRIEKRFYEIQGKNTPEEARLFLLNWLKAAKDRVNSLVKVSDAATYAVEEEEELIHATQNGYDGAADEAADVEPSYPKNGYDAGDNPNEDSDLKIDDVQVSGFWASAEVVGSINFDTSLEAALFYVRDGWAVVPCKDKVPLIKGRKDAKPGDGYTAACRDKGKVADYFTRLFPDAGVAIRLDNALLGDCILIDCDVKNGARGVETYEEYSDTFALPETLSAITPSGGRHHIFKLPGDLPADYLGSWTGILDGIDLKVGNKGLCHVEPTRGKTGVYRWIDPTADIAELPRAFCDYLHELHERQQRKPEVARPTDISPTGDKFDPDEDQAKFFKDMPNGQRRPRLRSIACCLASGGANEQQIVSVLNYHDGRFTEPTNDAKFIARVASGAVLKFSQGVAR